VDAYLGVWTGAAPEDELLELWAVAKPLTGLDQAISYRAIAANVEPAAATEFEAMTPNWLRKAVTAVEQT